MSGFRAQAHSGHLSSYFREVQQTHPLNRAEERHLADRILKGDLEARNRLVTANLRFALGMAMRYQGRGLPLEDLISAANLGLLEAARRFNGLNGVRFITYAVWWIRQSMMKVLAREPRLVPLPGHIVELVNRIHRASEDLQQELERSPCMEEIAARLDVPVQAVRLAVSSAQDIHSLDEDMETAREGGHRLMDIVAGAAVEEPLDTLEYQEMKEETHRSLETLKAREAEVIRRYYGLDGSAQVNLAEIGRALNLSRERVRQIKNSALDQLRHQRRSQQLRYHLEGDGAEFTGSEMEVAG